MCRIERIRNDFRRNFEELAFNDNIRLLTEWFQPAFPEDRIIANWISEETGKVLRVQEADEDEVLQFDFFTAKTGENDGGWCRGSDEYHSVPRLSTDRISFITTYTAPPNDEYDDLCIEAVSADEKAGLIYDIYKLWFVENRTPDEINEILEEYGKKLNSDKLRLTEAV